MPIKLMVPSADNDKVKLLGAIWSQKEEKWLIPDEIKDINPFTDWLPTVDIVIVKPPYFVLEAKRKCWSCNQHTELVALGAKNYYREEYDSEDDDCLETHWYLRKFQVLFTNIEYLDTEVIEALDRINPFFKYTFSNTRQQEYWANTCINCGALQGDHFNFYQPDGAFSFNVEKKWPVEPNHLNLQFDYYIKANWKWI